MHSLRRSTSRSVLLVAVTTLIIILVACGGGSNGGGNNNPPAPLQITTQSLPQGVVGVPYSTTLSATGGVPPYAWNASGGLPPGLSLSRAGVLSGTPTAAGNSVVSVAVADSQQPPSVANAGLSITINAVLQITTTSLPNGNPGIAYSVTLAATGGLAPYSWAITQGALPNGLTLNATSGVISGAPAGPGTSSFTVQVSDSETPAATATAGLSIVVNPPPPRGAALYTADGGAVFRAGLQIGSDGSLTLLPSSPELALGGSSQLAASPTLPLLFTLGPTLNSLLVNPDYSLASYSSIPLPGGSSGPPDQPPSVDPTGSNLYLPGTINSSGATGITIFPGNGSLQPLGTVAISSSPTGRMVFTPDATLAFIPTCSQSNQGSILSFSRSSNGMLTPAATYSGAGCGLVAMAVSSDGKYLATNEVQIYSIAGDGTLTAVLPQPFTIPFQGGLYYFVADLMWEPSGSSFLLVSTSVTEGFNNYGGVAVLSFSGSALALTVPPTGAVPVGRMQQTGSFAYAMGSCLFTISSVCGSPYDILGFDFQNGQLTPLPGAPYPYGNGNDMVIY